MKIIFDRATNLQLRYKFTLSEKAENKLSSPYGNSVKNFELFYRRWQSCQKCLWTENEFLQKERE
ncbi:hypothetical protein ACFO26_04950 [Lactococcus nasutitermitis]|uniref:Uncharacterized protein n=1 Tax=Lactococcus nasutitermitis TaxID=1652957 RepID=A0ABV9JFH9_9LACT